MQALSSRGPCAPAPLTAPPRPGSTEEISLPEFLRDRPIGLVFAILYVVATARGQGTYWLARVVSTKALERSEQHAPSTRWAAFGRWLDGEGVGRGARSLQRWGVIAVPISYLTVGFQTLVLAAAGVLRVPWLRFSVAQVPGALGWALIYSTIGWAAWEAALAALAGQPLALAGVLAVLVVVVATRLSRRTARRRAL